MAKNLVGLEVYNKRDGTRGTIVAANSTFITVQVCGINRAVTLSVFRKYYKLVPAEGGIPEEAKEEFDKLTTKKLTPKGDEKLPEGDAGIGDTLRTKFFQMVNYSANQDLDVIYKPDKKKDIVKYNGKNIFECTTTKRRFNVMCHPKSLTPDNLQEAFKIYPKSWGWALTAKFVFTDLSQLPLMRSIVNDGVFYRQDIDY